MAVAHGTGNAAKLLDTVKTGETELHLHRDHGLPRRLRQRRRPAHRVLSDPQLDRHSIPCAPRRSIDEDAAKKLRKSHENPEIKQLYEEYLGKPNGHKAHELLHTTYEKRELYSKH